MKTTDKSRWDTQKIATLRANRKASSAPRKKDLLLYEKFLKTSIRGIKKPQVLILGATPELRNLAIKNKCLTISTDISQKMINTMTAVMKYKNHKLDKPILCDWLKLAEKFQPNTFDAILADASINNIAPKQQDKILKDMSILLKKNKSLIFRHGVLYNYTGDAKKLLQNAYNKKEINWLEFYWILMLVLHKDAQVAPNQFSAGKFNEKIKLLLENKEIKFRKSDQIKLNNVLNFASKVLHTEFYASQFEKMARKYFKVSKQSPIKNKKIKNMFIYNLISKNN